MPRKYATSTEIKGMTELQQSYETWLEEARIRNYPLSKAISAIRTLEDRGYTYNGGIYWKPPLGNPPKYIVNPNPQEAVLTLLKYEDTDESICFELRFNPGERIYIRMSLQNFASLLTGENAVLCEIILKNLEILGKGY